MAVNDSSAFGVVVIGRNEGERLRNSLNSVTPLTPFVVYVDSGSTDGSQNVAKELGVEVWSLDPERPFSAARARNEGFEQLLLRQPSLKYIQFVDGDCLLDAEWPQEAIAALEANDTLAIAFGRRRERHPEDSLFNRLIDLEWNVTPGEVESCGGDSMVRTDAIKDVAGFNPRVVAGEEPELCYRLRKAGWKIRCLDAEMSLHDAAISTLGQWWKRDLRSGVGAYDVWKRTGRSKQSPFFYLIRGAIVGGVLWLLIALALVAILTQVAGWLVPSLILAAALLLISYQAIRSFKFYRLRRARIGLAFVGACLMTLAKIPQLFGVMKAFWNSVNGQAAKIVEYKPGVSQ